MSRASSPTLATAIQPSVSPDEASPRSVRRAFETLRSGTPLVCDGEAKGDVDALVADYPPRHRFSLFGSTFYLSDVLKNPALRFFVVYVVPPGAKRIHTRIFYKDISLVWRVVSHLVATDDLFWIGKGAVETVRMNGHTVEQSVESTTDLPLEMQFAVEQINRRTKDVRIDDEALYLVLRNAPPKRIAPYADFSGPMARAARNPKNRIHSGKRVARFRRRLDPSSLVIAKGYEPDFTKKARIDVTATTSATYGGTIRRFRVLSRNRMIQWMFMIAKQHAWIVPPQALTTELSTYGVRTVHVSADDDLFVPGFEYHFVDPAHDPSEHFSQIPEGFAGPAHEYDTDRADASAWLEQIPLLQQARRRLR
ncbi:MAG: hypothetical protein AAGE52_08195 [Myxococcota bacterium]